jgi:hypothetical protein
MRRLRKFLDFIRFEIGISREIEFILMILQKKEKVTLIGQLIK